MPTRLALAGTLAAVVAVGGLIAPGCGGSSPVTPPVVTNTPPFIESLAMGPRAEADQPLQVAATLSDAETPLGQLTYTWSASPQNGIFSGHSVSGSQAVIMWRPPKGEKTPDLYTVTLTVSEAYTSGGQAKQNSASSSVAVHYNDSPAEMKTLGYDFLVYKFGNFNVSPAEAVSNFSDSCSGKAAEQDQIETNRRDFHILSASFPSPVATLNGSMTAGTVEGRCTFEDMPNSGPNAGRREFVSGTCLLTTVYENFRWYLCDSFFNPPYNTTPVSLRGRVPGNPYRPHSEIGSY
jgi:hypothetical protein